MSRRPVEARRTPQRRLLSPSAFAAGQQPDNGRGTSTPAGGATAQAHRDQHSMAEPNGATAPGGALRVVMVDDDVRIRTLTRMLLERSDTARVVAEAEDGDQVIDLVRSSAPDVVLLDLLMPRVDGRAVLPQLVREAPNTMVLVLSALSGIDEADHTFALGAFAYLEKSVVGPDLPDQIRELHGLFQRALGGETVWRPTGPPRVRR